MLAFGWRAAQKNKPLFMLSTKSSAKPISVTSVATGRTAMKPKVVDDYNRSMNGVDKADQYTVYYSFIRGSHKGWQKLFFWLFKVNSFILYSTSVQNPASHFKFHQAIVESLVSEHLTTAPPRPLLGRPRKHPVVDSGDPERFNKEIGHYPKRHGTQKQCVVCSDATHGQRKRTSFFCPSHPSLCADACFEAYLIYL